MSTHEGTMTGTAVVEVVAGESLAEVRAVRDRSRADVVEMRLDGLRDLDVAGVLQGRTKPVIITCRPKWEGGRFEGPEPDRLRLLAQAVELGAEFVDIEWRADRRQLPRRDRTGLILSHHDFDGLPADVNALVHAMRPEASDVVKLAATPTSLADTVALTKVLAHPRKVVIGMGAPGHVLRVCPRLSGSMWTYGGTAAPGQLPVDDLLDVYRIREQRPSTRLFAITGAPLGHSASPVMHNAAFRSLGLDAVYVSLETTDVADFFHAAEAFGVEGASVTAPLKVDVRQRARPADELSVSTGAANTVRRRPDGGWDCRNYDVAGFLAPLDNGRRELAGRRVVVLGAGGAARTVLWALANRGARVEVCARRVDRAAALAAEFEVATGIWPPAAGWDLLVNTTPTGTWPNVDEAPLGPEQLRGGCVYDLIYNPPETRLLRWAREAGCDTIGGLEMLVGQACLQFEWWTGRQPSTQVMSEAARRFLARATEHS